MEQPPGFFQQIRRNQLALLSLLVALSALFYNTWRNEHSEHNRNIRAAEFEMLKNLGELQQVIDYAHFRKDMQKGDLERGLTLVLQIHDLGELCPPDVQGETEKLLASWRKNDEVIANNVTAAGDVSEEVLAMRRAVLASLRSLK
jgi:hypothetical protein